MTMQQKLCGYCHGTGRDWVNSKLKCIVCGGGGCTYEWAATPLDPVESRGRVRRAPPPPPIVQSKVKNYRGGKFLFRRSGHGVAQHKDGLVFEGNWSGGKWHGDGVLRYPGKWFYNGRFKNGMLHGQGTLTLENGTVFDGRFKWSVPKGKGVVRFSGGVKFEGVWSDYASATGRLLDSGGYQKKARILNGELQTKSGLLSRYKTVGAFDIRSILVGMGQS